MSRAKRAGRSAITIAVAFIAGGLIPLAPYYVFGSVSAAFVIAKALG